MIIEQRYNLLVVDPDGASRGKLKQVALALTTFDKVYGVASLREALAMTGGVDSVDVVALSYRYSLDEITAFVESAKKTPKGGEWAYVLVLKARQQKNEIVAAGVIGGIDGFLFEPYSAENLRELIAVTAKVKLQNELKRKKAAMMMFLQEIRDHLDAVAFYKSKGRDPKVARRKLETVCERLVKFKGEDFQIYVEAATEIFEKAAPLPSQAYTGPSKRVKERLETKMIDELDEKYRQP